jgi:uncharacterized protein (DUF169 family)
VSGQQQDSVQTLLGLERAPVAVGFLDAPPPGVSPWRGGPMPAGCAFWREAQEGNSFYTVPSDHYNCAVGAHTHGIPLPIARAAELEQTVQLMVGNGYLAMEEVPGIPTLKVTPAFIAYGPAQANAFPADLVVVAARPAQAMLLYEAALSAGAGGALMPTLGRPGCAVLPLAFGAGTAALSFGCKGNRTFTGLPDDEMYLCIPGEKWAAVAERLEAVLSANQAMESCYRAKQANIAAA